MRWYLLRPLAGIVGWGISILAVTTAILGCLRFFLLTGASPRYVLRRKRWYEDTMLGRRMRFRDFLAFGQWVTENSRTSRWH